MKVIYKCGYCNEKFDKEVGSVLRDGVIHVSASITSHDCTCRKTTMGLAYAVAYYTDSPNQWDSEWGP